LSETRYLETVLERQRK